MRDIVSEYPRAANQDWQAAKEAAGVSGGGTARLSTSGGASAFFHWGEVTSSFGQRVDTHTYPILGGYWQQPLSSEVNRFSVTGWIVGADYLTRRDQLSRVLHTRHDSDSPLILELPTYEPLAVLFVSGSQKEDGCKGGKVDLSLQFSRVLNVKPTIVRRDYSADVAAANESVLEGLLSDVAAGSAAAYRNAVRTFTALLTTASNGVKKTESASSEINGAILTVSQGISQATQTPGQIVSSLGAVVRMLTTAIAGTPGTVEREARRLYRYFRSWADYQLPGRASTPYEQQARNNAANTLRALGGIGTAQTLPALDPGSIEDARTLFAQLPRFDESLVAPGGELHQALGALKIAVREQLRGLGWFDLASEETIRVGGVGLPSLSLAQRLGVEEASIRAINGTQNSFFIGGIVKYVPV